MLTITPAPGGRFTVLTHIMGRTPRGRIEIACTTEQATDIKDFIDQVVDNEIDELAGYSIEDIEEAKDGAYRNAVDESITAIKKMTTGDETTKQQAIEALENLL